MNWRARPLFYAALTFSALIFSFQVFNFSYPVPQDSIVHELRQGDRPLFIGGSVISEVERREGKFGTQYSGFILKTEKIWEGFDAQGKAASGKIRVSWNNGPSQLDFGDVVVVEGTLSDFQGVHNPGGFDAKGYWNRQNVIASFHASKKARYRFLSHGGGDALTAAAIRAKQALAGQLSKDFEPRTAAFLQALFLGQKRELDQDFRDLFLKTGTMHILAVSGFNIGFLTAVIWLLLWPFAVHRYLKLALMIAAIWAYCLLVGWQAPVVRASVMATIALAGSFSGRRSDGLNALGLAALVILAVNPRQLFDIGFQLSFLAVFAIIVFVPRFTERPMPLPHERWTMKEKAFFSVKELFWVSFVCYLITLPVTVQNFFIVTPYSLIANLIVVPAAFLLFFAGFVYFLTFFWIPPALFFIPWAMSTLMKLMTQCLFFIENLPGSVITVGRLEPWLALFLFGGIFYFLKRKRAVAVVLFCALIFSAQEVWRLTHRRFEMTMLDVGQGDSIYFEFPKGGNMLIDAGGARFSDKGRWVVSPFLRSKGVRTLDTVVISHPQEDHIGGLMTVMDDFQVKTVLHAGKPYASYLWRRIQDRIREEEADLRVVGRGDRLDIPDVQVSVLHPLKDVSHKNINDDSVVLKVEYGDDSFLMTGDIQGPAMKSLLSSGQELEADVLKVPHHGAKLTADGIAFVQAVYPKHSLISAGARNPFGHPAPATLAALEAVPGNSVLRTGQKGAIKIVAGTQGIFLD